MEYYLKSVDGYITGCGTTPHAGNCTQAQYSAVMAAIAQKPTAPEGYDYRLKTDLTWEQYELTTAIAWTAETLGAMSNSELVAILDSYGISGSMTKANMVRLILSAQGGEEV